MQPLANVTPLKPPARAGSIAIRNVGQIFKTSGQDVEALSDVSLDIKPGRFVVLVGPSGCGKSTLLMMLAGLRQQTSGTILINDAPIPQPDPDRVGVVFQEPSLFPWLTAEENVEFPLALRVGFGGRVLGAGGAPRTDLALVVEDAQGLVVAQAQTDAWGYYRIDGLAPGSYRLRTADGAQSRSVELAGQFRLGIDLRPEPAAP